MGLAGLVIFFTWRSHSKCVNRMLDVQTYEQQVIFEAEKILRETLAYMIISGETVIEDERN